MLGVIGYMKDVELLGLSYDEYTVVFQPIREGSSTINLGDDLSLKVKVGNGRIAIQIPEDNNADLVSVNNTEEDDGYTLAWFANVFGITEIVIKPKDDEEYIVTTESDDDNIYWGIIYYTQEKKQVDKRALLEED